MPLTFNELADINNGALENYIDKGKVWKQNIQSKPLLEKLNSNAGSFSGGKEFVSWAVRGGQGGGTLIGYSGDDQVGYYNPTGIFRGRAPWREHHIGLQMSETELKTDGIDVIEAPVRAQQTITEMADREKNALVNLLDEKMETLGEDYAFSLNRLLWGDGTADAKALAGIQSILLPVSNSGTTFGINRTANTWWRNRAATAANAGAGGQGAITSSAAGGGALISFLDTERRQRERYRNGSTKVTYLAGSAFIDAYKGEMRANGYYTNTGWGEGTPDGSMNDPKHAGIPFEYDPTLDDLGLSKRCYAIDTGKTGIRLMYMDGQRMKKHNPARPYDRYVIFNGITMTGVLIAKQLNTSGVYDIA